MGIIQEPYVGAEGCVRPRAGFRIVQNLTPGTKPVKSAVVVFDDNIEIIESPILTTANIAVATLRTDVWEVVMISTYFEGSQDIEPYITHLKRVKEELKHPNIILGGDVNAWSTWWGSDHEDRRGEALVGALEELGLDILNVGNKPTFYVANENGIRKSIVDITTCSRSLLGKIKGWKVEEGVTSSDHNTISFKVLLKKPETTRMARSTRIYNTKKADWQKFTVEFNKKIEDNRLNLEEVHKIKDIITLENTIQNYTDSIKTACEKSIPAKVFRSTVNLPWWCDELDRMKRDAKVKKRRITTAAPRRRPFVVKEYLEAKAHYEAEAAAAQTSSWKRYCSTQDRETLWDGIYRVIRHSQERHEDLPLVRNRVTLTPQESVEYLAETFFPNDDESEDTDVHQTTRLLAGSINEHQEMNISGDPPFTSDELAHALSRSNPKKAPGGDGLTADIVRRAAGIDPELLLSLLNKCLELSCFPEPWKEAVVVVLRKPGKDDYTLPKSYRPIGLLSVLGKVLERMMVRRIRWHILPKANRRQYGFVPQRSTEDALYDLVSHLRDGLKKKLLNLVISLDIEGAFDAAWWPAIKCQLARKGCPQNTRKLVDNYLTNRKVTIRYADHQHTKVTNKGCVQGSISGPTLWNLLLDPLLDDIEAQGVYCQAFADDIVLVISADSGTQISRTADQILSRVYEWGIDNRLKFAPHKTFAMLVTKKLKYDAPFVHMGNMPIKLVEEIKILGLTIDNKLTFNNHIRKTCKKSINLYKTISRSAKLNWGLNPEIIRTIYVAVIEPIILYAASVWAPEASKISTRKCLDTVQRGFAQKITKSYRTVSLSAALALSGLIPLDMRVREAAELYEAKRGKPQNFLCGRQVERKIAFDQTAHPSEEHRVRFECLEDLEPETVDAHNLKGMIIYTDGSKIGGGVGAALSCWKGEAETLARKYVLASFCTVFQAELFALYQATKVALGSSEQSTCILSDSRSALELLGDQDASHPMVFFIKENLKRANEQKKLVRLFWVRAHIGIPGNERADELAKSAAANKKKAPDYGECPISFVKRTIRHNTIEEWDRRYRKEETGKTTKAYLPDVHKAFKFIKNNTLTPILTQALTGHGGYGEYLAKYKLKDHSCCRCNSEQSESILHLLIDCPILSTARRETENYIENTIDIHTIPSIIQDKTKSGYFLQFCKYVTKYSLKINGSTSNI